MSDKKKGVIPENSYNEHAWILGEPEIGENCWIGAFTVLDGSGGLKIGRGTDVSSGAHIYTHSTVKRALSEGKLPVERRPVEIGEHCHIGANATILMGASIGHHSVIGAGAVVREFQEIPPYSIAVGVPAKVVKSGKEEIEKYLNGQ